MYDVNGFYTETFVNTATLTGPNTDLEAHARVTIECRMVFQGETVTGAGDNAPWQLAPVAGNVKIRPLDAKPIAYIAPRQFAFNFTEPSDFNTVTDFCVTVSSGSYGYAIHLDAGFWVSG